MYSAFSVTNAKNTLVFESLGSEHELIAYTFLDEMYQKRRKMSKKDLK